MTKSSTAKAHCSTRCPVVRGKNSPTLRALFGYMYGQNGKKLVFMGGEFGQPREWSHERSLDWHVLAEPGHDGVKRWITDLNHFYREAPALSEADNAHTGFEWIDAGDAQHSVALLRALGPRTRSAQLLVVCNFTPTVHHNYRLGVPRPGFWREALNSDAQIYGGAANGNLGGVESLTDRGARSRAIAHAHSAAASRRFPTALIRVSISIDSRPKTKASVFSRYAIAKTPNNV